MIRIPPAYLEQIPKGVVRLCDYYPQTRPGVWYISLGLKTETSKIHRFDVNRSNTRVQLAKPEGDEFYKLPPGEIRIWQGNIPLVDIGAEGAWSYLDILGITLEGLRQILDLLNRMIWKEVSDNEIKPV